MRIPEQCCVNIIKNLMNRLLHWKNRDIPLLTRTVRTVYPYRTSMIPWMVYMVKYGTGQVGFVMDDAGKKHLKEVFDEMNYCDNSSGKTQIPAGESLGGGSRYHRLL